MYCTTHYSLSTACWNAAVNLACMVTAVKKGIDSSAEVAFWQAKFTIYIVNIQTDFLKDYQKF